MSRNGFAQNGRTLHIRTLVDSWLPSTIRVLVDGHLAVPSARTQHLVVLLDLWQPSTHGRLTGKSARLPYACVLAYRAAPMSANMARTTKATGKATGKARKATGKAAKQTAAEAARKARKAGIAEYKRDTLPERQAASRGEYAGYLPKGHESLPTLAEYAEQIGFPAGAGRSAGGHLRHQLKRTTGYAYLEDYGRDGESGSTPIVVRPQSGKLVLTKAGQAMAVEIRDSLEA